MWDAYDAQDDDAAPGSVCARLEASDAAGSFPYADDYPYLADPSAPVLGPARAVIDDVEMPRMGLGCMRLLSASGVIDGVGQTALGIPFSPEAVRHALLTAVDVCGVRYFDVARGYGPWPSFAERLLHEWIGAHPAKPLLASKVGYDRDASGGWVVDLDPDFIAREVDAAAASFDGQVPLLYLVVKSTPTTPVLHRPDDLSAAMKPLLDAKNDGRVKAIGGGCEFHSRRRDPRAPLDDHGHDQRRVAGLGGLRQPRRRGLGPHGPRLALAQRRRCRRRRRRRRRHRRRERPRRRRLVELASRRCGVGRPAGRAFRGVFGGEHGTAGGASSSQ